MALSKWRKKKFCDKLIVAMPLPKQGKKIVTIVAMALPKMGKKKSGPKSGEGKKKSVTFIIFLQYFHNKSHVISYYQFKFEFNTEIIFLIQQ